MCLDSIFCLFFLQLDLPPLLADQQPSGSASTSEAEFPLQGGSPLAKSSNSLLKVKVDHWQSLTENQKARNVKHGENLMYRFHQRESWMRAACLPLSGHLVQEFGVPAACLGMK